MKEQQIDSLVDKMVELSDTLRDLRMDARAEGLNVMALNFLINARTEFSQDNGNEVLREVVRYARASGNDLGLEVTAINPENEQTNSSLNGMREVPSKQYVEPQPLQTDAGGRRGIKLSLLKEIFLGLLITVALLWLLRY